MPVDRADLGKLAWGPARSSSGRWCVAFYVSRVFVRTRSHYRRKSSELGVTDLLTGLPNRKGLMAALEQFDMGPEEFGKRIRLIDVDLVNLDRVNYEFGQLVGDACPAGHRRPAARPVRRPSASSAAWAATSSWS